MSSYLNDVVTELHEDVRQLETDLAERKSATESLVIAARVAISVLVECDHEEAEGAAQELEMCIGAILDPGKSAADRMRDILMSRAGAAVGGAS